MCSTHHQSHHHRLTTATPPPKSYRYRGASGDVIGGPAAPPHLLLCPAFWQADAELHVNQPDGIPGFRPCHCEKEELE